MKRNQVRNLRDLFVYMKEHNYEYVQNWRIYSNMKDKLKKKMPVFHKNDLPDELTENHESEVVWELINIKTSKLYEEEKSCRINIDNSSYERYGEYYIEYRDR